MTILRSSALHTYIGELSCKFYLSKKFSKVLFSGNQPINWGTGNDNYLRLVQLLWKTVWMFKKKKLWFFFRAVPVSYGCSQARGPIGAAAAGLHPSHSNVESEPCLPPTPQLTAMPDP